MEATRLTELEPPVAGAAPHAAPPAPAAGRVLGALEAALAGDPTSFEFFQAVRLLERLRPQRAPVGGFGEPGEEGVRFAVEPSIGFPPSQIHALDLPEDGQARMSVNFMGVTGPLGVLPHHYTLLVAEQKRMRDGALGDFLDLFHHRALSLFYRVWERNHVAATYEKGADRVHAHLLDIIGMGLASQRELLPVHDDVLAFYAGLFAQQPRGAVALEQLIEDFFGVPVTIEQFVGGWYPVAPHDQCAVGEEVDSSTQLGRGVVVGEEVWDQQVRVRVHLGPLTRAQYDQFLPNGSAHEQLRALLKLYSHDQFDWEIRLILKRADVPGCILGADEDSSQRLGWSTWIRTGDFSRDAGDTFLGFH